MLNREKEIIKMDTEFEENIDSLIEALSILEKAYRLLPTVTDENAKLMLEGVLDDALMELFQQSPILKRIGGESIASTLTGKDVGSRRQREEKDRPPTETVRPPPLTKSRSLRRRRRTQTNKDRPPTETVMPPPSMKSSRRRRQRTHTKRRHPWSLTSLLFFCCCFFFFLLVWLFGPPLRLSLFY